MPNDNLLESDKIKFLSDHFDNKEFKIYQLAGDASARKYFRVICQDSTYVLMSWLPFKKEEYPFIDVLNHFQKNKVHVPKIINLNEKLGLILLEDLGDLTLERKFWEASKQENSWEFYKKTIDEIIKIHDKCTKDSNETICKKTIFDTQKFVWELNYAKENLIEGLLKFKLNDSDKTQLQNIFNHVSEKLHKEPKVICHRDYHSRNVMLKLDQVYVIDFQDARLGPVQYDLVSLIKDSYVDINDSYSDQMIQYYLDQTELLENQKISRDYFFHIYELQSIQRCFKACGSFASFMNQRQDRRYLKYLAPTLKRVIKSLTYFPEYQFLQKLIIDSGAIDKNYLQL